MNPPSATTEGAGSKSSPTTVVLQSRRLFFARAAWVALAALSVGLFVWSVPVAYEQSSTYDVALSIVSVLGFWAIGAILFWKSSGHRVALYASVMLVTFGAVQADTLHGLADVYPGLDLPVNLVYFPQTVAQDRHPDRQRYQEGKKFEEVDAQIVDEGLRDAGSGEREDPEDQEDYNKRRDRCGEAEDDPLRLLALDGS